MFTDIFVKRPVLASVVSLLIFLVGLRSISSLPLREYPKLENTVITVTTPYVGASADVIQGFITSPLQKQIAGAGGVDYLTAESTQGVSTIKAYIKLNFDPQTAFTNVMSKVAQAQGQLPSGAQTPVITKDTGSSTALMYMSFDSQRMTPEQVTDYISRVVQPKLETIGGVASAEILGDKTFAMRIWLNPRKMAGLGLTPQDVTYALQQNNYLATAGSTKGEWVASAINATTTANSLDEFKNLVVKQVGSTLIRLRDIATVKLGAENYDSVVTFNGKKAIFIGINATPSANPLTVISQVRKVFPELIKDFPPGLHGKIVYDATDFIRASIKEVIQTIAEATLIVIVVIFLFLGSIRSVLIPVVTIPLSLVGVCTLLLMLGYSINLLTLLALVLAIGLVVDDAIVVVENIHRHMEDGLSSYEAALQGAREIALPVISMTITLAAVYAPIGFMGGLTGALFKEFAFTLAATVVISGVVALTLSPMMCSKVLTKAGGTGLAQRIDARFAKIRGFYERRLVGALQFRPVILLMAVTVLFSCYFLYANSMKQLAPTEDQGALFISATAPKYANIDYVTHFTQEFNDIFKSFAATQDYFIINGMGAVNNVIAGLILKPWGQRKMPQGKLSPKIQKKLNQVPGVKAVIFPLPSLPVGGGGLPVQFVLTTTASFPVLNHVVQRLQKAAQSSGLFIFTDSSLKFNKPQLDVHIDKAKAAEIGLNMETIGNALGALYGGNYINHFSVQGRSYEVIPQVERKFRLTPDQIEHAYVKTGSGDMVPLSTVVSLKKTVVPNSLSQFQQLNSATLQGMMIPGHTIDEGLTFLRNTAEKIMPQGMSYDYAGQSRQFIQEGSALMLTLLFAIIVIYLILAALFESFRDPFIILVSVPMSICGALIPINLGAATINIYTQIGLVTLVGLISKHGILMVDFANHLRDNKGYGVYEAISEAAATRLRPILMTTAAMIFGVFPLIFARGAGAASRFDLGLVIASGMAIGTIFTLFVVPTMYTFFAEIPLLRIVIGLVGFVILMGLSLVAGIGIEIFLLIAWLALVLLIITRATRLQGRSHWQQSV
jgi:multidrug efflux pump